MKTKSMSEERKENLGRDVQATGSPGRDVQATGSPGQDVQATRCDRADGWRGRIQGLGRVRDLGREEDGQAIIFMIVFLTILVMALVLGVNLARDTNRGIQLQSAADSAALSATSVFNRIDDSSALLSNLAMTSLAAQMVLQNDWYYMTALAYYLRSKRPWECSDCQALAAQILQESDYYEQRIALAHDRVLLRAMRAAEDASNTLHSMGYSLAVESACATGGADGALEIALYPATSPVPYEQVEMSPDRVRSITIGAHKVEADKLYPRKTPPKPQLKHNSQARFDSDVQTLLDWADSEAPPIAFKDRTWAIAPQFGDYSYHIASCGAGCLDAFQDYQSGNAALVNSTLNLLMQRYQGEIANYFAWPNNWNQFIRGPYYLSQVTPNPSARFTDFSAYLNSNSLAAFPEWFGNNAAEAARWKAPPGHQVGQIANPCDRSFVRDLDSPTTLVEYMRIRVQDCRVVHSSALDTGGLLQRLNRARWTMGLPGTLFLVRPSASLGEFRAMAIAAAAGEESMILPNRFAKGRDAQGKLRPAIAWSSAQMYGIRGADGAHAGWQNRLYPSLDMVDLLMNDTTKPIRDQIRTVGNPPRSVDRIDAELTQLRAAFAQGGLDRTSAARALKY